jgi:hypothetical protein
VLVSRSSFGRLEATRREDWIGSSANRSTWFSTTRIVRWPFEVGSGPSHSRAGLRALAERHPRFAGGCWLVAPGAPVVSPGRAGDGIGTVPLDLFLLAMGAQAAEALVRSLAPLNPSERRSS